MKAQYQVGIIGAGFGGLIAALRLKESGRNSFVIFERANEVGGVWRDNTYPGCACDIQSNLYSIASHPNPGWSETYSPQAEIWKYLIDVTDKEDLRKHVRFNSSVKIAEFISEKGYWKVTDQNGNIFTVRVLISSMGPLNRPVIPKFNGLEDFEGKQFHSSQWDHNNNLSGKKVAVIGTGASAIQIVPSIAPIVKELILFQRTAAWVIPRYNQRSSSLKKKFYAAVPFMQRISRNLYYGLNEYFGKGFVGNESVHKLMTKLALRNYRVVKDKEVRDKLIPKYKLGCKRVMKSDDYLPTFNRENVHLEVDGIDHFTRDSIITKNGRAYKIDAVIFSTGFEVTEFKMSTQIIGLNRRDVFEYWSEKGVAAYLGITVSHYPNFGFLLGPNTGLGHNTVVHMMESQMNYLMQYIKAIEQIPESAAFNIKENVQHSYNTELQRKFDGTVWNSGCQSWYLDKNGKNVTLYPRLNVAYRKMTKRFNWEDYESVLPRVEVKDVSPVLS